MHSNIANMRTTHCHAHASRLAPSSRCAASFCENWVCLSWGLVLGPPQAATGKFLSRSESIPLNSSSYLSDKRKNGLFPTSLCGVLVFDSVSRVPPPPPPASSRTHTHIHTLTHNKNSHTINTHIHSHTITSHTQT